MSRFVPAAEIGSTKITNWLRVATRRSLRQGLRPRGAGTESSLWRIVHVEHVASQSSSESAGHYCLNQRLKYGDIVTRVFTPVLAKYTKRLSLVDILAVGVDRMQRNFEPMRKQVETWKGTRLPDESAKLVIYRAFVEGELDVPKHLARVSMISISIPRSRSSPRGRLGVSQTRSLAHSRTSIPSRSLRQRRSLHRFSSWRPLADKTGMGSD